MENLRRRQKLAESGAPVEPLDENEQRAVIDELRESNEKANTVFRYLFGGMGLILCILFLYAAHDTESFGEEDRSAVIAAAEAAGLLEDPDIDAPGGRYAAALIHLLTAISFAASSTRFLLLLPGASHASSPSSARKALYISVALALAPLFYWIPHLISSGEFLSLRTILPLSPLFFALSGLYMQNTFGASSSQISELETMVYPFKRL